MNITDILYYFHRSNNQNSQPLPLTFTTVGGNSTVKLIHPTGTYNCKFLYKKFYFDLNDTPVTTDWLLYNIGLLITLVNMGLYVSFKNSDSVLNKVNNSGTAINIYKFETAGGILDCTGDITSMINFKAMSLTGTFYQVFANCTNLRSPCSLPSKKLTNFCYGKLFSGCTGLIIPPQLPAQTVLVYSYFRMFLNCYSLSVAPLLPATILKSECYAGMFINCTSLIKTPYLSTPSIPKQSYFQMFNGCKKLSNVYLDTTLWTGNNSTKTWLHNVSPSGIFYKPLLLPLSTGVDYIPTGWVVELLDLTTKLWLPLTFINDSGKDSTITLKVNGTPHSAAIYYKRLNNRWWLRYTPGDVIDIKPNLKIQFWNKSDKLNKSVNDYYQFVLTGRLSCYGDTTSMVNYQLLTPFCFAKLFSGCTTLMSSPGLPSLKLADSCYRNMFDGCSNITKAPKLPATTLATNCYFQMFKSCKGLTTAPLLPALLLASNCYYGMLAYCIKIKLATLPATKLANACYKFMFEGCSELTTIHLLPATLLKLGCYAYMFYNCGKLTDVPLLPAKTLMKDCYAYMFYKCAKLTTLTVGFSEWNPAAATSNWVYGVSATGTFNKPEDLPVTFGVNNIPTGWLVTVLLPEVLSDYIYYLDRLLLSVRGNGTIDLNDSSNLIVDSHVIVV